VVGKGNLPRSLFSADARVLCAFDDVARANQTPIRLAQLPDDDVDGVMQPVREIAVEVTGWTEQGFIPIGHATKCVRSGVTFARVRFDLGDPDGNRRLAIRALEYATEKGWRDLQDVTSKKTTTRTAQSVEIAHRAIVPVTRGHPNQLATQNISP
jgi:hypothetical protein